MRAAVGVSVKAHVLQEEEGRWNGRGLWRCGWWWWRGDRRCRIWACLSRFGRVGAVEVVVAQMPHIWQTPSERMIAWYLVGFLRKEKMSLSRHSASGCLHQRRTSSLASIEFSRLQQVCQCCPRRASNLLSPSRWKKRHLRPYVWPSRLSLRKNDQEEEAPAGLP